ncbi:MAG TPA: GntR family transcriptional regulator [Gemmataceae bacterium]|jgi:GntR family transcriptional regulator|nr:GntR family transcriptional regulator [Gemmataceae bacterium]
MSVDPTNVIPLYAQVEAELAAEIVGGRLAIDAQVPTEDALIQRFGVSRPTVRKAIQNLASRGLVEIRRGTGTFVAEPKITHALTALSGFVEDMQAAGHTPSARVVDMAIVPATRAVARQLALTTGTRVVRIHRIRLADGAPISFDETYLPRDLGDKIMTDDLTVEPIFSLLERKYRVPLLEAEYRLEAIAAVGIVAAELDVGVGSPLVLIERTSYSTDHRPVDYEKLHYRGDRVRFVTRLQRSPSRRRP